MIVLCSYPLPRAIISLGAALGIVVAYVAVTEFAKLRFYRAVQR